MKYNFDEIVDYTGFENVKHEGAKKYFGVEDAIPMWVAEMDFRICPAIVNAMKLRVEHGVFGYPLEERSYRQSVMDWYKKRHHVEVKAKNINFHAGVINGISVTLKAFFPRQSRILIDNPVYHYFAKILKTLDYQVMRNPLQVEGRQFKRDMDVFEEQLKETDVFLLCSPHNPGGKIWIKEELEQISVLCKKHGVFLISDEIHSDLIMPGSSFVSMLEVDEDAIVISAASKSFNLAGMQYAFSLTNNHEYAMKIKTFAEENNYLSNNTLAKVSLRAAFDEGEPWLDQVNDYIFENFKTMKSIFSKELEKAVVFDLEASYLTWIDLSFYVSDAAVLKELMLKSAKVIPDFGSEFGTGADGCIRLNLATQKAVVEKAIYAICAAVREIVR